MGVGDGKRTVPVEIAHDRLLGLQPSRRPSLPFGRACARLYESQERKYRIVEVDFVRLPRSPFRWSIKHSSNDFECTEQNAGFGDIPQYYNQKEGGKRVIFRDREPGPSLLLPVGGGVLVARGSSATFIGLFHAGLTRSAQHLPCSSCLSLTERRFFTHESPACIPIFPVDLRGKMGVWVHGNGL